MDNIGIRTNTEETGCSQVPAIKVAAASMVGSAIESFDFIAYGTAVALVFEQLFFPSADGISGRVLAFAALGTGFLARPIGGLIFGHFGDRIGRKAILTLSLILMGCSTLAIGILPTYASIGITAQIIIILLRILQGISLGGELAGAMLMAVEHAPKGKRSLFGSMPQVGTPIGVLLCTASFAIATRLTSNADFLAWGWRLPFLASVILVGVGLYIRLRIDETPSFKEAVKNDRVSPFPARDVMLRHWQSILLIVGAKVGEVALYFTLSTYTVSYALTNLNFSSGEALRAVMIGAGCQIITIPLFGYLADKVGSRKLFMIGAATAAIAQIPLFQAIDSGSLTAFTFAVAFGLAISYSSLFATQTELYSAQFPVELRYTGVALSIQVGAALGGGLVPMIAVMLQAKYGSLMPIGVCFAVLFGLALFCSSKMRRPKDVEM